MSHLLRNILVARTALMVTALILMPSLVALAHAQVAPSVVSQMDDRSHITVLPTGDARVTENITFSVSAYKVFRAQYPTLAELKRVFDPALDTVQVANLSISLDELNDKVLASYTIVGWAIDKGDHWQAQAGEQGQSANLASQNGHTLVFTSSGSGAVGNEAFTSTVDLQSQASNIKFDSSSNTITYSLPSAASTQSGSGGGNPLFLAGSGVSLVAALGVLVVSRKGRA